METNVTEINVTKSAKKDFSKIGLFLIIGTFIIMGVQMLFNFIGEKIPGIEQNADLSFLCIMLPMYVIGMPIIFLMFRKIPVTIHGEKKKMKPLHIVVAFAIAYAGTYICNLAGTILTVIIGALKGSAVNNVVLNLTSSINPFTTIFVVVICAPIMEELMFRKMLIDRTYKYGEGMSIVFSGLIFGLFHGNLNQFVYAFLLGIFFGFIYVKTKNIVYTIILHMLINFVGSFVGSFIIEKSGYMEFAEKMTELSANPAVIDEAAMMNLMIEYMGGLLLFFGYVLCLFVLVIVGIVLFCVNLKKFTLTAGEVAIEKGKRFSVMILNFGMILYCIYWIGTIIYQLFQ